MKDPLQRNETPYEILEVPQGCSKAEIDASAKNNLGSGGNIQKRMEARGILAKPSSRVLTDMFLYNDDLLKQMVPVVKKPEQLVLKRADTVERWESVGKALFPYYPSMHSSGVLWYWWALFLEEQLINKDSNEHAVGDLKLQKGPMLETIWENTVAYWASLAADSEFIKWWLGNQKGIEQMTPEEAGKIGNRIEEHFNTLFHNLTDKYSSNSDEVSAKRISKYSSMFKSEVETGKLLTSSGVAIIRGEKTINITCGEMMLKRMGLLDEVKMVLEEKLKASPWDDKLQKIAFMLSPLGHIEVLIESKRFDEAINEIKSLPEKDRNTDKVRKMYVKAYIEKGRQHYSMKEYDAGLICWREGRSITGALAEVDIEFISIVKAKALALKSSEPDAAVKVLKNALTIINNNELRIILADVLAEKGFTDIDEGLNEAKQKGSSNEIISKIKKGIQFLEEAKNLGSSTAAANLPAAKLILEDVQSGLYDLSKETLALLEEAAREEKLGHLDNAVNIVEKAWNKCMQNEKKFLNKRLAFLLNQRAVKNIDTVMNQIDSELLNQDIKIQAGFNSLFGIGTKPSKGKKPVGRYILGIFLFISWFGILYASEKYLKINFKSFWGIVLLIVTNFFAIPLIATLFQQKKDPRDLSMEQKMKISSRLGAHYCYASGCSAQADYKYSLPKYGEMYLCSYHKNIMEGILNPVSPVTPQLKQIFLNALKDLERSIKLNPDFSQARTNLDEAKKMAKSYGLSTV